MLSPLLAVPLLASPLLDRTALQDPEPTLTWDDYAAVRDAVLPQGDELGWLDVPWRPVLWDAIEEARGADKPLFIWAMNGHPLGCT